MTQRSQREDTKEHKGICVGVLFLLVMVSCVRQVNDTESVAAHDNALQEYRDTIFWQEYHEGYPVNVGTSGEVRSIVVGGDGVVWIATPSGVFFKESGQRQWIGAIPAEEQGPSFSVAIGRDSTVWMSTWKNVYRFKTNKLEKIEGVVSPVSALAAAEEGMYAAGPHGIWLCTEEGCEKKDYAIARSVRDVISDQNGGVWVASDVGLYHGTSSGVDHLLKEDELISAYIRGVALDADRKVWAGGLGGVTIRSNETKEKVLLPENGIPSVNVNCVTRAPDGVMWVGTDVGVVRYDAGGDHSLLFSRRWLLDDKVNDVAFDAQGNAWVATANGVSAIKRKQMTLASKERYFYDVLMRRHIRDPWIAGQCQLTSPGDTTHWRPEDDDNDGEYTGNYLAMESFRYAVTKSSDAKEKAKKAFQFLKLLQEVTGTDGFFARTIVPADWKDVHDGNRTYTERELSDELVKEPRFKPSEIRWRKSADGKWRWKGDTSSDEICGHVFGYFFYYELVADDAEKKVIASHVAKIVDHLIAHDFTLTDVDDQHTRWGVWSPDKLNRDPEWMPDRSLNSMELLSFLKLAYHVTGDDKYRQHYLRLIKDEKYLENMAAIPEQNPAWYIYYDVMLAAYQYPILLTAEKDPALRKFYEDHLDQWLAKHKSGKNPLINFIYCYSRGKKEELQSSVAFLIDTPLDLIDWPIDHTKREDIRIVHEPVLGDLQVSDLPPASIRATVRWDKNPWGLNGGNPSMEREPVFWLLPYWMGRYLEMIR